MDGLIVTGAILLAVLAFVVVPEVMRRAHLQRVREQADPQILKPRGYRGWEANGEDYDEVWRP